MGRDEAYNNIAKADERLLIMQVLANYVNYVKVKTFGWCSVVETSGRHGCNCFLQD